MKKLLFYLCGITFIPLFMACGRGEAPAMDVSEVSTVIGSAGGSLAGPDGTRVVIPPGALDRETTLKIARTSVGAPTLPIEAKASEGRIYEFTPHDVAFLLPVTVSIPALPMPAGTRQDIITARPGSTGWTFLESATQDGLVSCRVLGFSWFGIQPCTSTTNGTATCVRGMDLSLTSTPASAISPIPDPRGIWYDWQVKEVATVDLRCEVAVPANATEATLRLTRNRLSPITALGSESRAVSLTVDPANPSVARGTVQFRHESQFADGKNQGWSLVLSWTETGPGGSASLFVQRNMFFFPYPSAPVFSLHPANQSVTEPSPASFTASAVGMPMPTLKWQRSSDGLIWTDIPGATSATYALPSTSVSADNGAYFRLVARNLIGTTFSNVAQLTVRPSATPPAFTVNPANQSVTEPNPATFSVSVSGSPAPSLKWQRSADNVTWADIPGATSNTYTLSPTSVSADHGARFRAVATNTDGTVYSTIAQLTVQPPATLPTFTTHPADQSVTEPASASFTVAVTGSPTPTLTWQRSSAEEPWTNIPSATSSTYTLSPTSVTADHGARFRAVATNTVGTTYSNIAQLAVLPPAALPTFTIHPTDQSVTEPASASFTVAVTGSPTPTLKWRRSPDGISWADIPGETSTTYTLPSTSVTSDHGARFRAAASNSSGTVESNVAQLTVLSSVTGSWRTPEILDNTRRNAEPSVGFDANGRAIAVWMGVDPNTGIARILGATRPSGGTWSSPAIIDAGLTQGFAPRISVAPNGTAVMAFERANAIYAARFDGGSWNTPVQVDAGFTRADNQSVAIDSSGRAIIAWYGYDGLRYRVLASYSLSGNTWSAPQILDGFDGGTPQVAVNGNGKGFVLFTERDNSLPQKYRVSAFPVDLGSGSPLGGTAMVLRPFAAAAPGQMRVVLDGSGNALVVWLDTEGVVGDLVWSRFDAGTAAWSPRQVLATQVGTQVDVFARPYNLALGMNTGGEAVVAWGQNQDEQAIFVRRMVAGSGTWTAAERISVDTPNVRDYAENPRLAISATGRIALTWIAQPPSGMYGIWASVYEGGSWQTPRTIATSGIEVDNDAEHALVMDPSGKPLALWTEWGSNAYPLVCAEWR